MVAGTRTRSCINVSSVNSYLTHLCADGATDMFVFLLLTRWRSLFTIALVLELSGPQGKELVCHC